MIYFQSISNVLAAVGNFAATQSSELKLLVQKNTDALTNILRVRGETYCFYWVPIFETYEAVQIFQLKPHTGKEPIPVITLDFSPKYGRRSATKNISNLIRSTSLENVVTFSCEPHFAHYKCGAM